MLKTINGGKEPTKGSKYSACIDLYANADVVIGAGETKMIPLGVCIDKEKLMLSYGADTLRSFDISFQSWLSSHCIKLFPRSSFRAKGLISHTGIIDLDFKDEWQMIVHNQIDRRGVSAITANGVEVNKRYLEGDFIIEKGDKVAQAMIIKHHTSLFGIETEEERNGGFGSTGNE